MSIYSAHLAQLLQELRQEYHATVTKGRIDDCVHFDDEGQN